MFMKTGFHVQETVNMGRFLAAHSLRDSKNPWALPGKPLSKEEG